MKVIPFAKVRSDLSTYVDEAQHDRVLITRHGKPAAIIIGVEGEEFEDLMTRASPEFWELIEARRKKGKTISSDEMRARLGVEPKRRPKTRRKQ